MNATVTPFPGALAPTPRETPVPLDLVIAQHGAWKVLRAALSALMHSDRHPPPPTSDYLRRDIGLPELPRQSLDWPLTLR